MKTYNRILGLLVIMICMQMFVLTVMAENLIEDDNSSVLSLNDETQGGLISQMDDDIETPNKNDTGSDPEMESWTEVNYEIASDLLVPIGTAELRAAEMPSDEVEQVVFFQTEWIGNAYSFLAEQHFAYVTYANAEVEYTEWSAGEILDGVLTPGFDLRNGEKLYLEIRDEEGLHSVREVLDPGVYVMEIKDTSGVIWSSCSVTIEPNDPVQEITEGIPESFDLGSTNNGKIYHFIVPEDDHPAEYPMSISAGDGICRLQCVWDDGERLLPSNHVDIAPGKTEKLSYSAKEAGNNYFIVTALDENGTTGSFCIGKKKELVSFDLSPLPSEISLGEIILNNEYEIEKSLAVAVTYDDGSSETLKDWQKDDENAFYYTMTDTGRWIRLNLLNEEGTSVGIPSVSALPKCGIYRWNLSYTYEGEQEETAVGVKNVSFVWGIEEAEIVSDLSTELILDEGDASIISFPAGEEKSHIRISGISDSSQGTILLGYLYRYDGETALLDQKITLFDQDIQNLEIDQNEYELILSSIADCEVTIYKELAKTVTGVELESRYPDTLEFSQLLLEPEMYVPSENLSAIITYDDGSSETTDNWEPYNERYVTQTEYGTEAELMLCLEDESTLIKWNKEQVPPPGVYKWRVTAGGAISEWETINVSDDDPNEIEIDDGTCNVSLECDSDTAYVQKLSVSEADAYRFIFNSETLSDGNATLYMITNGEMVKKDVWDIMTGWSHLVHLDEGEYYLAFQLSIPADIELNIESIDGIERIEMAGNLTTKYTETSSDVNESFVNPDGLTVRLIYVTGDEETVTFSEGKTAFELDNGQILTLGVVMMQASDSIEGGVSNPVLLTGSGKEYYSLMDNLEAGNFAIIPIIDDEPVLDSYIPIIVGHAWDAGRVTKAATTTSTGIRTYTCKVCGDKKTETIGKIKSIPSEKITISKKPTIKKPAATKNKITVKWKHFKHTSKKAKKLWKPIKGVQIQCATDKTFTNIVKTATAKKSKTSAKIKGLAKKTTYYVRVRYYDGTGYSAWSKVKKVKTK